MRIYTKIRWEPLNIIVKAILTKKRIEKANKNVNCYC